MNTRQRLTNSAVLLSFTLLLSKIFGFIRQMLMAKYFGAGAEVDAYLIATEIPLFASALLVAGLSSSFIPVFTEYISKGKEEEGWRLLRVITKILLLVLIITTILGIIFVPQIISLLAPGFDKPTHHLATNLARITMPYFLFSELGTFIQSILQSYQFFTLIIWWQVIPNLILIAALVLFSNSYGIFALAIGFFLTGVLYFLFLFYGLGKIKKPQTKESFFLFSHPGLKKIGRMFIPMMIGASAAQIVVIVDRYLASYLTSGSIATLYYSYRVILVPNHILSMTIMIILFSILSQYSGLEEWQKFRNTIFSSVRIIFFLIMPMIVYFYALNLPIIRIIYERGEFSPSDTIRCAQTLKFFSFGLIGWGMVDLFTRSFFATQNAYLPIRIGILAMLFNIIASITLVRFYGINGLALAASLTALLNASLLYLVLRKYVHLQEDKIFYYGILKIVLISFIMLIFLRIVLPYLEKPLFLITLERRIFTLGLMMGMGGIIYILLSYILKLEEPKILWQDVMTPKINKLVSIWGEIIK